MSNWMPTWAQYAYHHGGCGVIAHITDDPKTHENFPSHEAMVMDERCTCGLRALVLSTKARAKNDSTAKTATVVADGTRGMTRGL